MDKLFALALDYPEHLPIILWDDRCRWREAILPQYKLHRWRTAEQRALLESYLAQASVVRQLLAHLGLPRVFCPDFEADDLAGVVCRGGDPDWEIVLATSDRDWVQAIRKNVTWLSPSSGATITLEDFGDGEGIEGGSFDSTDHFVKAKALAGDASDGIPGIDGVGLKTAAKIIGEHGSVEALWAKHDAGIPIKGVVQQRAAGPDYRETYLRNLRLVDRRLAPPLPANVELQFGDPDGDAFERACDASGLSVEHKRMGQRLVVGGQRTVVLAAINRILLAAEARAK